MILDAEKLIPITIVVDDDDDEDDDDSDKICVDTAVQTKLHAFFYKKGLKSQCKNGIDLPYNESINVKNLAEIAKMEEFYEEGDSEDLLRLTSF